MEGDGVRHPGVSAVKPLLALIAVVAALAAPAVASAGLATITFRDVPLTVTQRFTGSGRSSSSPGRFDLVGVRWHGSGIGAVQRPLDRGCDGGRGSTRPRRRRISRTPARARRPQRGAGASATRPGSVPPNGIRYRIDAARCAISAPRSSAARSSGSRSAPSPRPARRRSCRAAPGAPTSRSGRATPSYAPAIRFASVHHTAGTNSYSPAQAAAIMRGIEVYHVKSNGWNDIGYNFLVDRYGTVYEGRYGGIDRNVIGAYARGFNTGSIGVAVIGTFSTAAIPRRGRGVAREASRLAARPRPRRSRLHAHLRLGRQRAVSGGCAGRPARRLRSPRHRADDLPGRPPLRASSPRSRRRRRRSGCRSSTSRR